jgi:dipeptidyl aminopeptidase/acylaminoacyl peptidase
MRFWRSSAKAYTGETTGVDIADSPTITAQMTEPGVILGTAAYMSPEQARELYPEFSPDGRRLAYASNESVRSEIYLRSFPGGDGRVTISNEGGNAPLWAPDGRELFYWNLDYTKLMKVDIPPGQDLPVGTPKVLLKFAAGGGEPIRCYDITPDGWRFLIRERPKYTPTEVTQLNLVQNWFEELNRLCPVKK